MKKRLLMVAATAMLALGLAACGQAGVSGAGASNKAASTEVIMETIQESTENAADSDWYMQALNDPALLKDYSYYKFVDLNGDGVPILFLSTTKDSFIGDENNACLIAYANGQPKVLKKIGNAGGESFYCDTESHLLTYFWRLSGEGHLEVYQVKGGELTTVETLDNYGPLHDPEANGENKEISRRINGKDVSEEEYTAAWDKYASEQNIITYDKIALPK